MRAAGLAAALIFGASQAQALSCMRADIERSFNGWVEADETYYIGVGSLRPLGDVPDLPDAMDPTGGFEDKEPVTALYQFSGRLLDGRFGQPADLPITVSVTCLGPWCGNFPAAGAEGLMALRGVGIQNLTLDMHACPGSIFPADTEATVNECMRDGRCAEPARQ